MLDRREILSWLRETDPRRLERLWQQADAARQAHVGEAVHLRGLLEVSNHCVRLCAYCGLRRDHAGPVRYRMTADEIVAAARVAVQRGCGTIVLQGGEDDGLTRANVEEIIVRIKTQVFLPPTPPRRIAGGHPPNHPEPFLLERTPPAVTLSLGERPEQDLHAWRQAGADRYLLRFETSNPRLLAAVHPPRPGRPADRIDILRTLRGLGYETGSGVMVGLPGQSYDDLADDIELFRSLDLDMIGLGPFLPHPATPLGRGMGERLAPDRQAPNTAAMTCKVVALARLVCPLANIPATTALATLDPAGGLEAGLRSGANVVMPNVTPPALRRLYEIYPDKACIAEGDDGIDRLRRRIEALGRTVATGRGDSPNRLRRTPGAGDSPNHLRRAPGAGESPQPSPGTPTLGSAAHVECGGLSRRFDSAPPAHGMRGGEPREEVLAPMTPPGAGAPGRQAKAVSAPLRGSATALRMRCQSQCDMPEKGPQQT